MEDDIFKERAANEEAFAQRRRKSGGTARGTAWSSMTCARLRRRDEASSSTRCRTQGPFSSLYALPSNDIFTCRCA
jgi:hypothetical protein